MKKNFTFLFLLISIFVCFSCSILNIERASSIVIDFGSAVQNRTVSYTKDDLSYFLVSIEPKVQSDIKVDVSEGKMTAEFNALKPGTYKIKVSAFSDVATKIAYGESELVEVEAGETTSVPVVLRFNILIPEGFVKVDGVTINGTESWTPNSSVFIAGRQFVIPSLIVCDHEVTRGEFKEIMRIDPSTAKAYDSNGTELTGEAALNNPVNYVNWDAAIAYCNKLSLAENLTLCYSVEGITDWAALEFSAIPAATNDENWKMATCNFNANGYRLPTEAEWEWLARGGKNNKYAGSDTVNDVAWYNSNSNLTGGVQGTREVKTKVANAYGLYDMSGNIWEWCWDWYESPLKSAYGETGPASGSDRVLRGGTWFRSESYCEIVSRSSGYQFTRNNQYGFRVVRKAN